MITVFGSINMDLVATTPRLPKPGETVPGTGFATAAAGTGATRHWLRVVRCIGAYGGRCGTRRVRRPCPRPSRQGGYGSFQRRACGWTDRTALILVGGDGENMIAVVRAPMGPSAPTKRLRAVSSSSRATS